MWSCVFYGDALRSVLHVNLTSGFLKSEIMGFKLVDEASFYLHENRYEQSSFHSACVWCTGQLTEQETFQKNKASLIL